MQEPSKPHLRVVQPGDMPQASASPVDGAASPNESEAKVPPPAASWAPIPPKTVLGRGEFDYLVGVTNLRSPQGAMRALAAGRALVSGALDLRHYAAEARPGVFLRGVTPGEKSVEALDVVLTTHQAEVMGGSCREAELRRAVLDASQEVIQSVDVCASVGMDSAPRAEALFQSLRPLLSEVETRSKTSSNYLYLVGAQSQAVQRVEGGERNQTFMVALVAGLVGGLVVAVALA